MFLKRLLNRRHDLSFRLALWYAGILMATLLGTLVILYLYLGTYLRHQVDSALLNELREFNTLYSEGGLAAIEREMELESESEGIGRVFFRLVDKNGQTLLHSDKSAWRGVAVDQIRVSHTQMENHYFETSAIPDQDFKARLLVGRIGSDYFLQIVHSLREDGLFLSDLATLLMWFAAALVMIGVASGWYISGRAMSGINAITQAAEKITAGQFDTRAEAGNQPGEIDKLAATFNTMLDRIQTLVAGMREVTDNIAHDLKSPIARIRTAAELALHGEKKPAEYTAVIANTIRECDRLLALVDTMLFLSEMESGTRKPQLEKVDLAHLVNEACDLFQPLAEDKRIALAVQQNNATCIVPGESATLQRMIANLLDNAIKYTPEGGRITVQLKSFRKEALLVFEDNGIGIARENLPRIFERFYRCDKSRHQRGSGLGLSLARAIAEEHGGNVQVSSRYGHGTVVTVSLPRSNSL